jgi:GxxExxY protein
MTEEDITYQIRGAIYNVYKAMGPGLLESIYEEALAYELRKRGLKVERQLDVPIYYDGQLLRSHLRLDLIVEDAVIIELKSVEELLPVHFKQTLTYLRMLHIHKGILVNFNTGDILKGSIFNIVNGYLPSV